MNGNIELNPGKVLDNLASISDSPHSAILYFINEIAIQRPDLIQNCAEVAVKFEATFKRIYGI